MANRSSGRKAALPRAGRIQAHIRGVGMTLPAADADYARLKLERSLGRFAGAIERASMRFEDINGSRGGVDKLCRVKVVLPGLPTVLVEERHRSLRAAVDVALERTKRAVRRSVQRRRTQPRTRIARARATA